MVQPRRIELHGRPIGAGAYPSIITPLVGRDAAALRAELAFIVPRRPDMLEWRIDHFARLADTDAVIAMAREIRAAAAGVPLLLTRRSVAEGGQAIALAEADVVALYARMCHERCVDLIDCELSQARAQVAHLRAASASCGVAMILSFHDFRATPGADEIVARFVHAEQLGADIAKVAVMPAGPSDVLALLGATQRASQAVGIPLIGISMGGIGVASRVFGWQFGSAATFAAGLGDSAPGQLAIEELRAVLAVVQRAGAAR
jgi:3-dehydroquinate dehydratase-1